MIKSVIFDVGGVLAIPKNQSIVPRTKHRLGVHSYLSKKLKLSLDQWIDSIDSTYADAIEGKISEKKFLSTISKKVKISPKRLEKLFIKAYKKNYKKNKELYQTAFKLKKKGYTIAILSDQHYASQKVLMPEKQTKKFDVVVTSCNEGIRKPDIKIYKLILKKLKICPIEALFIDNQKWNLNPAKKLGMKTILFKNNHQLFKNKQWKKLFI